MKFLTCTELGNYVCFQVVHSDYSSFYCGPVLVLNKETLAKLLSASYLSQLEETHSRWQILFRNIYCLALASLSQTPNQTTLICLVKIMSVSNYEFIESDYGRTSDGDRKTH